MFVNFSHVSFARTTQKSLLVTRAAKIMRHQAVKSRVLRVEQGGSLSVSAFATYDKGEATLARVADLDNRSKTTALVLGAAAALSVQDVVIGGETKGKTLNFNVLAAIPLVKNLFSKSKNKDNITIPYEPEKPKAYLEVAIFADSLQTELLTTKQLPISENAEYFWEKLQDSLVFEQDGFAVVSLKNSSDLPVLFDNLELTLYGTTEAMIVQENHYEPFGMTLKGLDYVLEEKQKNKFLYNGESERTEDLGLLWDETPFRPYDKQLGRFHGVDELADFYNSLTPFQYALNNPISFNDPTGLEAGIGMQSISELKRLEPIKLSETVSSKAPGILQLPKSKQLDVFVMGATLTSDEAINKARASAETVQESHKSPSDIINNRDFGSFTVIGVKGATSLFNALNDYKKQGYEIRNLYLFGHGNIEKDFVRIGDAKLSAKQLALYKFSSVLSPTTRVVLLSCFAGKSPEFLARVQKVFKTTVYAPAHRTTVLFNNWIPVYECSAFGTDCPDGKEQSTDAFVWWQATNSGVHKMARPIILLPDGNFRESTVSELANFMKYKGNVQKR